MDGLNIVIIIAVLLFARLGVRLYKNFPRSDDENDTINEEN